MAADGKSLAVSHHRHEGAGDEEADTGDRISRLTSGICGRARPAPDRSGRCGFRGRDLRHAISKTVEGTGGTEPSSAICAQTAGRTYVRRSE